MTGKTSTTMSHLVAGMTSEKKDIPLAYLSKPHVPFGNSYGHLPGDIMMKVEQEFKSFIQYFDRFGQPGLYDALVGKESPSNNDVRIMKLKLGISHPVLEVLPFEYLRGRDIELGWVVLDESQNTTKKEMSGFISRVCDRAKLIMLGDTNETQIDRKGNTPTENGLAFAEEVFLDKKYTGVVEFQSVNHILRGNRVRDLFRALNKN